MKVVACARRKAKLEEFKSVAIAEGAKEDCLLAAECDVQKEEDIKAVIASVEVLCCACMYTLLLRCLLWINSDASRLILLMFYTNHSHTGQHAVSMLNSRLPLHPNRK